MVLTPEQALLTFQLCILWAFCSHRRLNEVKLRGLGKVFFNWSANESILSFVARLITGDKCAKGVTLDDKMGKRTRGIHKFRHQLLDRSYNAKYPPRMAELTFKNLASYI
jgi:hypothetical protein